METTIVSDFIELINPTTRMCRLLRNGKVIEEYKLEQCDQCSQLTRADVFGFVRGQGNEKLLWFCGDCR
jgi:hypothetical protein